MYSGVVRISPRIDTAKLNKTVRCVEDQSTNQSVSKSVSCMTNRAADDAAHLLLGRWTHSVDENSTMQQTV